MRNGTLWRSREKERRRWLKLPRSEPLISKLQKIQNEAIRICLSLPRYIRIDLLHEYASMSPVQERLVKVNRELLKTMTEQNDDVRDMLMNHKMNQNILPKSPLDILDE